MFSLYTFDANDELDQDLFRIELTSHATDRTPYLIGDVRYDEALEAAAAAEATARMLDNLGRAKDLNKVSKQQKLAGGWTPDALGSIGETVVRLMLPADKHSAAFIEGGTDKSPDALIDGLRYDVKTASRSGRSTFSVTAHKVDAGAWDVLILVKPLQEGLARVWVVACDAESPAFDKLAGRWGKPPFYLITCPDPAPQKKARRSTAYADLGAVFA
jgi:hypothetical protein